MKLGNLDKNTFFTSYFLIKWQMIGYLIYDLRKKIWIKSERHLQDMFLGFSRFYGIFEGLNMSSHSNGNTKNKGGAIVRKTNAHH